MSGCTGFRDSAPTMTTMNRYLFTTEAEQPYAPRGRSPFTLTLCMARLWPS